MTRQLNTRISDLQYYMFLAIQDELEKKGFQLNQREILEWMIARTLNEVSKDDVQLDLYK